MRQQKFALILAIGLLGSLTHFGYASNKNIKNESKLPLVSKQFIKKHFPTEKISYVIIDVEGLSSNFEVKLSSGKEIEFYKNGDWKEIDAKKEAIPEAILPEKILQYVKDNFEDDVFVVQIEKKILGIEVELSNKLEIDFTSKGKFIRYDN